MGNILAHLTSGNFVVSGDDVSPFSGTPQELLDHIIYFLHDDRQTLIVLSLVSKQTMLRSRHHLFSDLEFTNEDRRSNKFFALLDVPWTTFTHVFQSLCIKRPI